MQALNVFFGGTLHTCIPGHQQAQGDLIHPTRARGLLSQLLGPAPLVNSNHHQAVRVLGEELCLLQQAADGTIEGFCHETLPILGVQWHPEYHASKEPMSRLFNRFVEACAQSG